MLFIRSEGFEYIQWGRKGMITTVTLNPSLDYFVSVRDFRVGVTNRTTSELILPGGKGINVSTVLSNLGIRNRAICITAGFVGQEIIRLLAERGVEVDAITVEQGCSRLNLKLRDEDDKGAGEGTEINGMGPEIPAEKLELLMEKLDKLGEDDTLVLAGTVPGSLPSTIYSDILERISGKGVRIVVDATKELLLDTLKYHPFLIKPNHHELGEFFGVKLEDRMEEEKESGYKTVISLMRRLQQKGAENILCSLAKDGAVLLTEKGEVFVSPAPDGKVVNAVGSGDSMVAGFLAGCAESDDPEYALKLGLAAGSASAFVKGLAGGEEIRRLMK